MLRGRLALASVYLFFVCLLGLMPQPAARPCSPDTLRKVGNLIEKAPGMKEKLNCSLYTPTDQDFETCPKSTLKCLANETKVLIQEWEAVNLRVIRPYRNLSKNLEILSAEINQSESECRQCEFLNEQNAEEFLKQLKSTLEIMNRRYC
uniref:Interleukin n=1 Tax=Sander lucioperca TaxID=283035 RepID=A0A8C9XLA5_SANLU